jgi:murein DD-endopeptidase MepM/ murein hydrolase activator NlpD
MKKHLAFLSLFLLLQVPVWALASRPAALVLAEKSASAKSAKPTATELSEFNKQVADAKKLPQDWAVPVQGKLTNPFGNGYWYFGVYRGGHTGIDLKAPAGTPVVSASDGKVVFMHAYQDQRYGYYVVIKHVNGFYALYGHLARIQVKLNQELKSGDRIGDVGRTGAAGYPHLHFEVMNHVPVRDGAWGYAYICRKPPVGQDLLHFNFLNLAAREMPAIRRQRPNGCADIPLRSPLVYYNPEMFFNQYEFKPWLSEFQPENEEVARWRKPKKNLRHVPQTASQNPLKPGATTDARNQP